MGLLCGLGHYLHADPPFVADLEADLTVGISGGDLAGYLALPAPTFGSLTDLMIIDGHDCLGLYSTSLYDFIVLYEDPGETMVQGDWITVSVEDGTDVVREYDSADAILFARVGGYTYWRFGDGTDRVYVIGDDTEVHPVGIDT